MRKLFIGVTAAWGIVGILNLINGDISRVSYGCALGVALMYMILAIIERRI